MEIRLYPEEGDPVTLAVSEEETEVSAEEILRTDKAVRADQSYRLEVDLPAGMRLVKVQVDDDDAILFGRVRNRGRGKRAGSTFSCDLQRAFRDKVGLTRLSLLMAKSNRKRLMLYSEYAAILLPAGSDNDSVLEMLSCIYQNQPAFLYREKKVQPAVTDRESRDTDAADTKTDGNGSLGPEVLLLDEIAETYEDLYGYFKANSRYELRPTQMVDHTDRMQYADSDTMRYMVQHPEYLRESPRGIPYGHHHYLPDRVLMTQNRISLDIYENRLVISFLAYILREAHDLEKRIEDFISDVSMPSEGDGYVISFQILYQSALDSMKKYQRQTQELVQRLERLFMSYRRIFDFDLMDLQTCPRPTPVMQAVPQYRRIFTCMMKWYSQTAYGFTAERNLLRFMNTSSVYEIYVLVKLITAITEAGFTPETSMKRDYGLRESRYYHNDAYNNTFVFTMDDIRLSLFYTPVIYSGDSWQDEMISLCRNTSVSYTGRDDDVDIRSGNYYVPDFVLKAEQGGEERYLICDAKFKRYDTTKFLDGPKVGFKYLLSLSPTSASARLSGLAIIYGKTEDHTDTESFYDSSGDAAVTPAYDFSLVPVSEDIPGEEQRHNLDELIRGLIAKL